MLLRKYKVSINDEVISNLQDPISVILQSCCNFALPFYFNILSNICNFCIIIKLLASGLLSFCKVGGCSTLTNILMSSKEDESLIISGLNLIETICKSNSII